MKHAATRKEVRGTFDSKDRVIVVFDVVCKS